MKKVWVNIIIFFGCFLLLLTTLGTVLIMAPGMELLGVMYIRSTSGAAVESKSVTETTSYEEIIIKSDNIPIMVEFVQSFVLTANMVEEYNGFAKAGAEPTLDVELSSTAITINSKEYESFLAYSRSEESGLVVKVPTYYSNKLKIESRKSSITFAGLNSELADVKIKTGGKVVFKSDLIVDNLELSLGNNDAIINDEVNIEGYMLINSERGDVYVPDGFTGNLYFKSNSGDIFLASCDSLKVESKTGSVGANGDKLPKVLGDVNIKTNGNVVLGTIGGYSNIDSANGDITIGNEQTTNEGIFKLTTKAGDINLLGEFTNEDSEVKTSSGDVFANKCVSMSVETKYGNVKINDSTRNTIKTKSGDVLIKNAYGIHNITTNNGDVVLGEDGKANSIEDLVISTIGGDIVINNTTGSAYDLKTKTGDIKICQDKTKTINLTINSKRGDVEAKNIKGKTTIKTNGNIFVDVAGLDGLVNIEGKNRKVKVIVHESCYYDIASKKNIESAPGLEEKTKTYKTVPSGSSVEDRTIMVRTAKGKIQVGKV